MNLSITEDLLGPDRCLISLTGEVDIYTAPEFKQTLYRIVDEDAGEIFVDLTAVSFVDSTFLGVLVGARRRRGQGQGEIIVVCPNPNIRKVFEITGLDRVFTIQSKRPDYAAADQD